MINRLGEYFPEWSKTLIRLIFYKQERRKLSKERKIRKIQDQNLPLEFDKRLKKLIVFVVPGANWDTGEDIISGGIISIVSIYEETRKLKELHRSEVIMVTGPGEYLLLKHTKFENKISVFRFEQLFSFFDQLEDVLFHIPEYKVQKFISPRYNKFIQNISGINYVHINILNQNFNLMPEPKTVERLKLMASFVTQTTAHKKYATEEFRQKWNIPLHQLSVFGSPEKYIRSEFIEKKKIIVISPDKKEEKNQILERVSQVYDDYTQIVIENMPYEVYRETVKHAKFSITFGEGLDFYFLETVFSGGFGIAVFNREFMPENWRGMPGIFNSYNDLKNNLINFLQKNLSSEYYYKRIHEQQFEALSLLYSYSDYQENIRKFYLQEYQFS